MTKQNPNQLLDSNETQGPQPAKAIDHVGRQNSEKSLHQLIEDFITFGGAEMLVKDLTEVHSGWLRSEINEDAGLTPEGKQELTDTSWSIMRMVKFFAQLDSSWERFKHHHPEVEGLRR